MNYHIVVEKPASKFIAKLPQNDKVRLLQAINKLPFEGDIKALQGKRSKGYYRLRVGDYRVIYTVDNGMLVVRIIDAGNRGQIYHRY